MKGKQQILHIHGGMPKSTHEAYLEMISQWDYVPDSEKVIRWSKNYSNFLDSNFEILRPQMPNGHFASYKAWDIWFQKIVPYIKNDVVLVGHSLGGGFLMKWLSENILDINIKALHLVAPTFDYKYKDYPLGDFENSSFPGIFFKNNIATVHLYHSKDDPEVPIIESENYSQQIPNSQFHIFEDRGHFLDETFPELFKNIENNN